MNPLHTLCLLASLLVVSMATPHQNTRNSLDNYNDPSSWVNPSEVEQLPSLNEISFNRLEKMSVDDGATLLDQLYHLAQFNRVFKPTFTPEPSQVKGYIVSEQGRKIEFNLNNFVQTARRQPNFGNEEVTIFIEGLPQNWNDANKATRKLVQAYEQRYNMQYYDQSDSDEQGSSEEQRKNHKKHESHENSKNSNYNTNGDLVVINLGDTIKDFEQYVTLNVQRIGAIIGDCLVQLTNEANVPQEIIHLIGQGQGAHVAGAAGRQFIRRTGHKLRRITGLDPARLYAKADNALNGLARGDADFVDAIHTSAYGIGMPERVGDVDFYPNGPSTGVPGADNVLEASLRAVRYFAESVRPGNERNFPAVAANSYKEYKQNNGYGKRTYMGIATNYDAEGDYMLQVNAKSPFGRNTPAQTQVGYHTKHEAWRQQTSA